MICYPKLTVWVGQDSFPASQEDGRFPKENAPVPREVNRKKQDEIAAATLIPLSGDGHCSTRINYLYPF
uniref:Neuronal regeneration-related protein n=1 Tax=Vombatus ursinus TaxID=29139 RepID=A0A4X2K8V7_VOMUR